MPRKTELTWQAGTGGRQGRWRKKYRGRVCYFAFGRSKSDLEGYKQAVIAWQQKKDEIDVEEAQRPRTHQDQYEQVIERWTHILQWSVENDDQEHADVARRKIEQLKARLSRDVLPPLGFSDGIESLYECPPELLERFLQKAGFSSEAPPDPRLATTVTPSANALKSMDGSRSRLLGEVWADREESQRRKARNSKDTVEALVDSFLTTKRERVKAGSLSAGRYDPLRVHLHHLRDWLGPNLPVASISGKVIKDYHGELLKCVADEKLSSSYAHDRMNALKGFVRWLWRTEAIEALPRILDTRNEDLRVTKKMSNPAVFTIPEVKKLLKSSTQRTKLYLLLMLNTGMGQKDLSDLRPSEVDWKSGTITRKRSKTAKHDSVPVVTYILWKETLRLLRKERAEGASSVLVNDDGGPLKVEALGSTGKLRKIDNVASAFARLRRKVGIQKPLKLFRKTSATLLKSSKQFSGIETLFLGHSPRSMGDRHYAQAPQSLLDAALVWLGKQYGLK
ncbi:MAG: tyrosine-type recombinase/integrase [Planctomycetaceae bacterium]|nr:tyrosine-type recombinase/integrase [Planctomycetaceae bacterium]